MNSLYETAEEWLSVTKGLNLDLMRVIRTLASVRVAHASIAHRPFPLITGSCAAADTGVPDRAGVYIALSPPNNGDQRAGARLETSAARDLDSMGEKPNRSATMYNGLALASP